MSFAMYDSDKQPIALFELELKDPWGSTEYAHARIRIAYEDEETHTPRWLDAQHPLSGLLINSQGNSRDTERRLYGFSAEFRDLHSVDLRKAESMAKTLRKIEKGLEAANSELGYPQDYPEYARRVLKALGIKQVWFTKTRGRTFSEGEYRKVSALGEAADSMRYKIRSWENREDEAPSSAEYSLT